MSEEIFQIRRYKETMRHPERLQYRVRENVQEIGIQEPIWGEWQFVHVHIKGTGDFYD